MKGWSDKKKKKKKKGETIFNANVWFKHRNSSLSNFKSHQCKHGNSSLANSKWTSTFCSYSNNVFSKSVQIALCLPLL